MTQQTDATIYLANKRHVSQADWFRSYRTFEYADSPGQKSFGSLWLVNDETLKAGKTLQYTMPAGINVMLLPIVGGLNYRVGPTLQGSVDVGEAHVLRLPADAVLELTNPYEQELINFLQVWIAADNHPVNYPKVDALAFDLRQNANTLIPLVHDTAFSSGGNFWIGKFDGRKEAALDLTNLPRHIFVFVINGAFEAQNRLLQTRDALSLTNVDHLELEALSNEAIVLVLQLG